jgi:hypothetical protein
MHNLFHELQRQDTRLLLITGYNGAPMVMMPTAQWSGCGSSVHYMPKWCGRTRTLRTHESRDDREWLCLGS